VRIVLVRLSALGDIIHCWPLASAIADSDSSMHLSWIVEEPLRILVDGHPAVDSVFTTRTGRWRRQPLASSTRAEISALKTRIRELEPDLALDPQGTVKSALVTRWTGAPRRIGLARPWRRERLAGLAYSETAAGAPGGSHVTATNLAMARAIGIDPPELVSPDGRWLLERVADCAPTGSRSSNYAVILPGTGGAHKVIPEADLATVGRSLIEAGMEVLVAWGPGEKARAAAVVEGAGGTVTLAPPTDLRELAGLLGGASLVVGGDTGPVHLAASFGVPTVAVFLASDWRRNGPLGPRSAVVSGAEEGPARPSGSARVPSQRRVTPEEIISAACKLLDVQGDI
jgi:heptosyltransferase-1